ncbi:TIGR04282 family arsenosugar biosynthesis glycosyltransferase [Pseudooceanicola sp. LIPI14-2-Ac024]|uniref:TIGR04282 family arsenosugar biosynthesis glycosyltransferase n=1 Tax=Pseudooceanicola sp. LIPI14-2-Ac024 TaxID=3344875 RepID=UPI0035CFBB8A
MAKLPRAGRVKTRLGRDIGMVPAAWWMRHRLRRLLRDLRDPRWDLALAVAPDTTLAAADWPRDLPRLPQGPGDLGQRMARQFRTASAGPLLIVGADIPGLRRGHITRAFALLGRNDAVLGPATDGGYWLIGLHRTAATPATLFRATRWSSPHALADTLASLPGARIVLTDTLSDVDTAADLAH